MNDIQIDSVLVADDDPLLVLLFAQVLKDLGVKKISTACDGKRAVELYKKHKTDLVILDMEMPVKNGYLAAKEIKQIDPDVKIVILTGNPSHPDIEKALAEGVITYLFIKPISVEVINRILLKREKSFIENKLGCFGTRALDRNINRDIISAA